MNDIKGFDSEFSDAITHEEDLLSVISGNLHIEVQVNLLIDRMLHSPDQIKNTRFQWGQKIDIVCALGLRKQYNKPLKQLGTIRNKFAHEPGVRLEKKWVDDLYNCLHKEDQNLLNTIFLNQLKKTPLGKINKVSDLNPKDKFVIIVCHLHATLRAANYLRNKI